MRVTSCGITDVGLKRSHNEDNLLINEELNLFVVADGMGGHNGGEFASAICVNTVEEIVENMEIGDQLSVDQDDPVELVREKLRYALRLAGRRIFEKASESPEFHGMGTTAVSMLIDGGNAFIAHVGDSRLYLVRDDRVEQVTEDHSFVARQIKAGVLTAEEARSHRMRNVIYRSLGYQEDVEVDVEVRAIRRGDQFLLCSDGLSGHVEPFELFDHVTQYGPQEAARRLVDLACERGGDDNITVVIASVDELS
ncbi:MAG: Stp1/IreP family PP2C-type Ser/Thr phosphatase [Deltaproteobacteria bacterium]|nr:MAG: Stp1/IreP family PP2C-type Ser/Thr phosphatase [Deltaproteobacteria bacterium]